MKPLVRAFFAPCLINKLKMLDDPGIRYIDHYTEEETVF